MAFSFRTLLRAAASGDVSPAERDFRRNVSLLVTENAGFVIAITFVGMTTVVPTFVTSLGGSPFLVGLIGTCQTAGWLLPQLVGAGIIAGKPQVARYILAPLYFGRPAFLIVGVATFLLGARWEVLALLFLMLLLFFSTDGISTVPWLEFIGKAIPRNRRGRMFGAAQIGGGLGGIAAGWVIGSLLKSPHAAFPYNYAILFCISGGIFIVNISPFLFVREPETPALPHRAAFSLRDFIRSVGRIVRTDANFRRTIAARLLFGTSVSVFPFYVVFMTHAFSVGPQRLGLFTSSQVLGGLLGGLTIGSLADRFGSKSVAMLGSIVVTVVPAAAFALAAFAGQARAVVIPVGAVLFVLIGVAGAANVIGFVNYVLESSPAESRATYVGLFNTLAGSLLVVAPLAGGLLELTSYSVVFALAAAAGMSAIVVSHGLRSAARPQ